MSEHECEHKGHQGPCVGTVKLRHSMTRYHWDPASGTPDPNRDFYACDEHNLQYREFWTEQWNEYYSAIGSTGLAAPEAYEGRPSIVDEFKDFISDSEDRF